MTIKTKLQLTTLCAAIAASIVGLILFVVIASMNARQEEMRNTAAAIEKFNELHQLSLQYNEKRSEKTTFQWISSYDALRKLLSINFSDDQRQVVLQNLEQNFEDLKQNFDELNNSPPSARRETSLEWMTKLQLVQNQIFELNQLSETALATEERNVKISFALAFGTLLLILMAVSYRTRTDIVEPLSQLAQDIKIVGKGKLKYTIKIFRNDEIGDLAKAFSLMVNQLKSLTQGLEESVLRRTSQLSRKIGELEKTKKTMAKVLQTLEELNMKDKVILRSIGEGMVITDPNGKINFSNKACEDHFQFHPDQMKGKNFFDYVSFENGSKLEQLTPLRQAISQGKKMNAIAGYLLKNGSKNFPITLTISPLIMDKKNIGAIVLFHDVSKERELEDMKHKFLAFVSDQLRTPLGSLRWTIEMLLESDSAKLSPELKKNLEQMYENNQRIIKLVNELLDVFNHQRNDLEQRIQSLSL